MTTLHPRRKLLLKSALAAAMLSRLLLIAPDAQAATDFPSKPITIVVPFAPGGPFDIIARAISVPLSAKLGQPVIVENTTGASGMIGTAKVARAKADGYTLLLGSSGTQALNPNVFAKVPYRSPEDFAPIVELASVPSILMVGANSKFKTVQELVDSVRKNPGQVMMGNAGAGSVSNQAAMTFLVAADGKVTPVPYKGTAPAIVDLMGGQIDALFDTAVQSLPHVKSGKVRALAVTSATRIASLPNVPTLNETCCKGTDLLIWYGLLAPAGTPKDVVAVLTKAALAARTDPQFSATMQTGEALLPPPGEGTSEFAAKISRDVKRFADLSQRAGVVKE